MFHSSDSLLRGRSSAPSGFVVFCSRGNALAGATSDLLCNEVRVLLHPPEQRRAARVLPGEAEEVDPRDLRDAAVMAEATVVAKDRKVDPAVVGPVSRCPDNGVDVQGASVSERDGTTGGRYGARLHRHAVAAAPLARGRAEQGVAVLEPTAR